MELDSGGPLTKGERNLLQFQSYPTIRDPIWGLSLSYHRDMLGSAGVERTFDFWARAGKVQLLIPCITAIIVDEFISYLSHTLLVLKETLVII